MGRVSKTSLDREQLIAALRDEGLVVTEWSDAPNAAYDAHAHARREVRVVLAGELIFLIGSETLVVGAGERIDLAPGEVHAAQSGPVGATYLAGSAR